MTTTRLEAFSDGVIAIIITIMVLELRAPHESTLAALQPLWPVFLSYVMSFIYLGIYWSNHHHLLHAAEHVNGRILWANLHLLFWLSLVPFATAWMGETYFSGWSVPVYGVVLLATALGSDFKGKISIVLYVAGIALSLVNNWIGFAIYVFVAIMWLVPDRRIEKRVGG
jgi:TMEM175 potassium channel family protein